jgi:hypothetical protein
MEAVVQAKFRYVRISLWKVWHNDPEWQFRLGGACSSVMDNMTKQGGIYPFSLIRHDIILPAKIAWDIFEQERDVGGVVDFVSLAMTFQSSDPVAIGFDNL